MTKIHAKFEKLNHTEYHNKLRIRKIYREFDYYIRVKLIFDYCYIQVLESKCWKRYSLLKLTEFYGNKQNQMK